MSDDINEMIKNLSNDLCLFEIELSVAYRNVKSMQGKLEIIKAWVNQNKT